MNEEIISFLKSFDFAKLGQAINHRQWQAAAMNLRRMDQQAHNLGFSDFERQFTGLRQAINRKNSADAKQVLSILVSRRAAIINKYNSDKLKKEEAGNNNN